MTSKEKKVQKFISNPKNYEFSEIEKKAKENWYSSISSYIRESALKPA